MLETQKAEMSKLATALETMKGELTKETQARDAIKAQLDPLVPMVQQTEPMVAEALKKKNEADAAAANAKGQLDGSAAAAERWKAELTFLARLGELEADLKAREDANLKTLEQLGMLEAVAADWEKQKLALEGQVTKWNEEKGASEKEVVALDASYVDLTGKIQVRVAELTARQSLIAQLGKSIESSTTARDAAKASLDLMAGDAELTAALAALQTALDGQSQKVKLLQEGLVSMTAEKDAWEKMAAETMASLVAKKQSVEQLSKNLTDAVPQLAQILAKWNESMAAVVPVKQQAEAAEKGIEEALRAIAAHQGVADPVPIDSAAPVAAAAAN
jgi:chromosome segregation ATPase